MIATLLFNFIAVSVERTLCRHETIPIKKKHRHGVSAFHFSREISSMRTEQTSVNAKCEHISNGCLKARHRLIVRLVASREHIISIKINPFCANGRPKRTDTAKLVTKHMHLLWATTSHGSGLPLLERCANSRNENARKVWKTRDRRHSRARTKVLPVSLPPMTDNFVLTRITTTNDAASRRCQNQFWCTNPQRHPNTSQESLVRHFNFSLAQFRVSHDV